MLINSNDLLFVGLCVVSDDAEQLSIGVWRLINPGELLFIGLGVLIDGLEQLFVDV